MANVLPKSMQVFVLRALVEGCSMESTARIFEVNPHTVCKLLIRVGAGCQVLHDEKMRNLSCKRLEVDEIWQFIGKKSKHATDEEKENHIGDAWTFVAIDSDTKLVPAYRTGHRSAEMTHAFMKDVASRLANRVQLTSDGFITYAAAVDDAFGAEGVDYAQLHKTYEGDAFGPRKYSPPQITGIAKKPIFGSPEETLVSTSFVERNNLNIRMGSRRFTRLTNAFSKKPENHDAAIALHFAHHNFVRIHQSLRVTPAMAAGIETTVWSVEDLLDAAFARSDW